jgi:hypothetical protein
MENEVGRFMVQTCSSDRRDLVENWSDDSLHQKLSEAENRVNEIAASGAFNFDQIQIISLDHDLIEMFRKEELFEDLMSKHDLWGHLESVIQTAVEKRLHELSKKS